MYNYGWLYVIYYKYERQLSLWTSVLFHSCEANHNSVVRLPSRLARCCCQRISSTDISCSLLVVHVQHNYVHHTCMAATIKTERVGHDVHRLQGGADSYKCRCRHDRLSGHSSSLFDDSSFAAVQAPTARTKNDTCGFPCGLLQPRSVPRNPICATGSGSSKTEQSKILEHQLQ
jgi:hypothetical protein